MVIFHRPCFLEKHLKRGLVETKLDIFTVLSKQGTARLKVRPALCLSSSELLSFSFDTSFFNITIFKNANLPRKQFHFANLRLRFNSGLVPILHKTVAVPAKLLFAFYSRSKMADK